MATKSAMKMETQAPTKTLAQAKWYVDLCLELDTILEALEVNEEGAAEIKTFMLELARNQYLAGNRSGIRWAREQAYVDKKTA